MPENQIDHFQQIDKTFYLPVFKRYSVTLEKGRGAYLWDINGKKYIDALAGIATNSVGHCHPNVVKAIKKQSKKLIHISNSFLSKPQAELAEKLVSMAGFDKIFIANSGAEANECAFKLARKYAHNKGRGGKIIYMENCFHGRTLATLAAGKAKYMEGFEPIPEGFEEVHFNDIEALKKVISNDVAAIIIELIQGEGGIHIARKEYISQVKEICDKEDILLIFDEIQTGMGRTGKMFGFEHYDVKPDIMTLGKAIGGGFPVSATLFMQKVANTVKVGDHGSTFGGNPLACAASLASINTIEKENLAYRAYSLGEKAKIRLMKGLDGKKYIKEIRCFGLMIGIEITFPGRPVVEKMLEKGIVGNFTADSVIRIIPPLVIKEKDLNYVIDKLIETLEEVSKYV